MPSIMKHIGIINRCAILFRSERLKGTGLNGIHHTYIINICKNPGISQERLSGLIYINKSNVTRQLVKLEDNGYVRRVPSPTDKRVMLVYPTQKALDALPVVMGVLNEWSGSIFACLDGEELAKLEKTLLKISKKATETVEDDQNER